MIHAHSNRRFSFELQLHFPHRWLVSGWPFYLLLSSIWNIICSTLKNTITGAVQYMLEKKVQDTNKWGNAERKGRTSWHNGLTHALFSMALLLMGNAHTGDWDKLNRTHASGYHPIRIKVRKSRATTKVKTRICCIYNLQSYVSLLSYYHLLIIWLCHVTMQLHQPSMYFNTYKKNQQLLGPLKDKINKIGINK